MRRVIVDTSDRLQTNTPSKLADLERLQIRLRARGTGTIDLGRFAPDLEPDRQWLEEAIATLNRPGALKPATSATISKFHAQAHAWFERRFGVTLRPRTLALTSGVREGLHHLATGLVNPGDRVALPTPAYPFYRTAIRFAGGLPVDVSLREERGYLPNLTRWATSGHVPRIFMLNYPHNPTGTPPDPEFYAALVKWARRHNVIIIQDFAYGEIYFDQPPPISILNVRGARHVAVELHSFSFTYHVPGLKLGLAVGHPDIVRVLQETQAHLAATPSEFAVSAGTLALDSYERLAAANNREFTRRRDAVARGLTALGWSYQLPAAGGFFWVRSPRRDDLRVARRLLVRAGVLVAPGSAFGAAGEGFLRIALTRDAAQIEAALARLGDLWPERLKRIRKSWGPSDSSA